MGHKKHKNASGPKGGGGAGGAGGGKGRRGGATGKQTLPTTLTSLPISKNFFLLGLVAGILVPCFPYIWQIVQSVLRSSVSVPPPAEFSGSSESPRTPDLPEYERVSLFEPYAIDYDAVLRVREENMKKYSYPYERDGVDKRSDLSLQEFWDVYDGKWPVVVTDVVPKWDAANWTRDFFHEHYGKERVTMKAVDLLTDIAISAVLPDYLHLTPSMLGDLGVVAKNGLASAVSLALPLELFYKNTYQAYPNRWTYIEDELFIPMRPDLKKDIGECKYLEEDYFRLFPPEVRPWDAMLLWGTRFSRSSLHIDPYNWTGTNAVFRGRKRWKLYPPGQDHLLSPFKGRKSGFPLDCFKYNSPIDAYDADARADPNFAAATAIEFDQLPGEMLFIPTGWFHQAFNVEETIAVSSQTMNTNNVRVVLEEVLKVGNVRRDRLPRHVDSMSPADQVRAVMSLLPAELIARGREVTKDALDQIAGEKVHPDVAHLGRR